MQAGVSERHRSVGAPVFHERGTLSLGALFTPVAIRSGGLACGRILRPGPSTESKGTLAWSSPWRLACAERTLHQRLTMGDGGRQSFRVRAHCAWSDQRYSRPVVAPVHVARPCMPPPPLPPPPPRTPGPPPPPPGPHHQDHHHRLEYHRHHYHRRACRVQRTRRDTRVPATAATMKAYPWILTIWYAMCSSLSSIPPPGSELPIQDLQP